MIKIVQAHLVEPYKIHLTFSNQQSGIYDVWPLIAKDTVMVQPLKNPEYFQQFFLELGALCWDNGFELSPSSIYYKLKHANALTSIPAMA